MPDNYKPFVFNPPIITNNIISIGRLRTSESNVVYNSTEVVSTGTYSNGNWENINWDMPRDYEPVIDIQINPYSYGIETLVCSGQRQIYSEPVISTMDRAVFKGHKDEVDLLLLLGEDPNQNHYLLYSLLKGNTKISELLRFYGAKLSLEEEEILLKHGIAPNYNYKPAYSKILNTANSGLGGYFNVKKIVEKVKMLEEEVEKKETRERCNRSFWLFDLHHQFRKQGE